MRKRLDRHSKNFYQMPDCLWRTPRELVEFKWDKFRNPVGGLAPFATNGAGDFFCWYLPESGLDGEPVVMECPFGRHDGRWFAPGIAGTVFRQSLEWFQNYACFEGGAKEDMGRKRIVSRSWFRFRIHTLLIIVALACVYLGAKANHARVQKHAVAAIAEARGSVRYRHQADGATQSRRTMAAWMSGVTKPDIEDIAGEPPGPKWVRALTGDDYFQQVVEVHFLGDCRIDPLAKNIASLSHLEVLYLRNSHLTDRGVEHFVALSRLRELDVSGTDIGDQGLSYLGRLRQLESLTANTVTNATDDGWAKLGGLHNLKYLSMEDAAVNDALRSLAQLPSLQTLKLAFSHVGDDGLKHLVGHKSLRSLNIEGTYVTDQAAKDFRTAMPNCKVTY